ncbi:class I SAM-dependent methyltransferase [Halobacillus sp. B23F22_1]|uniref:class I SAM-dependent methyltransferase n=1 Tax=Halobacillus sp. B23F22_1 TaxID=3459514 RepID=UPI00373E6378
MKPADFSKIADVYDYNSFRHEEIGVDHTLKSFVKDQTNVAPLHVLDLACGTGIYLNHQKRYFQKQPIKWYGADASDEMLHKAKEKLQDVSLTQALAENLPYRDEVFHYICSNYAFHHFTNKETALDEVKRVLKKGGVFKIHNINPYMMKKWWVYHYFPEAYQEDVKRFWQVEDLFNELTERGFEVKIESSYRMENVRTADYLSYAENRDISVLTLIDDKAYERGLNRMRGDVHINPDKKITNDFAEIFCIAKKSGK